MEVTDFSLHLAYSTYPSKNEKEFVKNKLEIFSKYRELSKQFLYDNKELDSKLYKPLVYHLFGSYDIVFISLIDNYQFGQKVLDEVLKTSSPSDFSKDEPSGRSINFQIATGSCIESLCTRNNSTNIKSFFPNEINKPEPGFEFKKYVQITNFKVNNGLLIGNGHDLIQLILKKFKEELSKHTDSKFIIVNSFNWSEIILIQLGNNLEELQGQVVGLRELSLSEITVNDSIINNSLYGYLADNYSRSEIDKDDVINSHLFVDSHSYSGVDYYLFNQNHEIESNPFFSDKYSSTIEVQVKPGHLNWLCNTIDNTIVGEGDNFDEKLFDTSKLSFKNGKTDYLLKERFPESLYSNYLTNKKFKDSTSEFSKHIRQIKTNSLYNIKEIPTDKEGKNKSENGSFGVIGFNEVLGKEYTVKIGGLKRKLKRLGVSRHLKEKVLKAFYNYNNIVQDVILFNEFIELKGYLENLLVDIDREVNLLHQYYLNPIDTINKHGREDKLFSLNEIEKKWKVMLDIFETAYSNRVHNNYLYEDINEFSMDFNSAVNQVNTIHDYTVKTFNNVFFPNYKDAIIVTQNEIESKSNIVNVNYNVYHYLEPSLIFSSLMKEVMNGIRLKAGCYDENYFEQLKKEIYEEIKDKDISVKAELLFNDFNIWYFFADVSKYIFTFLYDYDLYKFWGWTYFLQDTSIYMSTGLPDERLFAKELFRISLVKRQFFKGKPKDSFVENPVPELFHLWQRNVKEVNDLAIAVIESEKFQHALEKFQIYLLKSCLSPLLKKEEIGKIIKAGLLPWQEDDKFSSILDKLEALSPADKSVLRAQLEMISNLSKDYKLRLRKKEIIQDENLEKLNLIGGAFYAISAISHATLTLFKGNNKLPNLLRRNWVIGEPITSFIQQDKIGVLVDPCGGFFTADIGVRTKNFAIKNAIIQSLWGLVLKDKKRLFTQIENEI